LELGRLLKDLLIRNKGCKGKLAQFEGHYGSAKSCDGLLSGKGYSYLDGVVC